MALITCSECDGEVSDKAAACPKCGAPVSLPPPPPQKGPGRNCPHCATFVPAGAERCTGCQACYSYADRINPRSRIIYSALGLIPFVLFYIILHVVAEAEIAKGKPDNGQAFWCSVIGFAMLGLAPSTYLVSALSQLYKGKRWYR
jgi:hypothetical protein